MRATTHPATGPAPTATCEGRRHPRTGSYKNRHSHSRWTKRRGPVTGISRGDEDVAFDYDRDGQHIDTTLPDGIVESYGYDAAGQLGSIHYANGATTLGDLNYAYDGDGRRIAQWGSYAATAVPASSATATYDAANELVSRGSATYSYDADGELTNDGTSTYTWDARGHLTAITGGTAASFVYDPMGRRIATTTGGSATTSLYDGMGDVLDTTAGVASSRLTGLGSTFAVTTAGTTQSLLTDALGSTVGVADDSGVVGTTYTYDPFGNATTNGSSTNNVKYTGLQSDPSGLDYTHARYYSPALGRFISSDPAGEAGSGNNLYAYGGNDPVDTVDPTGEDFLGIGHAASSAGLWLAGADEGFWAGVTDDQINKISGLDPASAGPGYNAGHIAGTGAQFVAVGVLTDGAGDELLLEEDLAANAESPLSFFRGARPGEEPSFAPRPNEFKVDPATGYVRPTHGVSVFDNPASVSERASNRSRLIRPRSRRACESFSEGRTSATMRSRRPRGRT